MDLTHLNDQDLLANTELAAKLEREATTRLLWHLWEVQRRRLFAKAGTSSLFDYCVRVLKMSEPQAARRVNAARALAEIPELEEKINSGALTLTAASQAQSFFNREARADRSKSLLEKKQILSELENRSVREADRILLSHTPDPATHRNERCREVSDSLTEIRLTLDAETMANLERLKEIWSHSLPSANFGEVIKKMAEMVREQMDPVKKAERSAGKKTDLLLTKRPERSLAKKTERSLLKESAKTKPSTPAPESKRTGRKHPPLRQRIPSAILQRVWLKEGGRCTFKDPISGRTCGSRHLLQLDHIKPVALGGQNSLENLRLRCFAHNQWHAVGTFGKERMRCGQNASSVLREKKAPPVRRATW